MNQSELDIHPVEWKGIQPICFGLLNYLFLQDHMMYTFVFCHTPLSLIIICQ